MKPKSDEINKLYYSMNEIVEQLQVSASQVRFWERELNLTFKFNAKGNRFFKPSDVELIRTIKHLRFERKFTMQGVDQELRQIGLIR